MKVSIEIGHKWCGQMVQCLICGCQFVTIRQRGNAPMNCHCPGCGISGMNVGAIEYPWTGTVEVEVNDKCSG